ncbi:MerR family transcriptional regulator [Ferviditalea candida]|uniref:MerR family transcriptional regulator n=1 Tax=Ferviditalea candida TaxID=3108399 RepID=A0ABU5ZCK6_9BACL|nr:MerR family transcriptional regulator [Paenibacillaceae bacterium T2]
MNKLYKIGELARLANVSPRTVDYYTTLGLILPEKRTGGNYRLYSDETLVRLKRIDELKKAKYSLEEVKEELDQSNSVATDAQVADKIVSLRLHLEQLEREVHQVKPMIARLNPSQARNAFKHLTPHTVACIEALLVLLGKDPMM